MAPKSLKKVQQSLWHACSKCEAKVNQNKVKFHEKFCGDILLGIIGEKFGTLAITYSLPPEIVAKDASVFYLQRFLFVPEAVCLLCNFTMGCNLLIEVNGKKYVRNSWTINDKHADEVFTSSEGK